MTKPKRKSQASYVRLLKLFEKYLKEHHSAYDNDYYKINYIIQQQRFSNDVEIKLILTILKIDFLKVTHNQVDILKKHLENFSKYFSITDITIVNPFSFKPSHKAKKPWFWEVGDIEDRIFFDLYVQDDIDITREIWRPV